MKLYAKLVVNTTKIKVEASPFLTCFPYRRSPSAYFEGTHGVRFAWGNTRHSHRYGHFSIYATALCAPASHPNGAVACTVRQARRSLFSPPCGSCSVCESVYFVLIKKTRHRSLAFLIKTAYRRRLRKCPLRRRIRRLRRVCRRHSAVGFVRLRLN